MQRFLKENKEYLVFYLGLLSTGLLYVAFGHRTVGADKIIFLILAVIAVCVLLYQVLFSGAKKSLFLASFIFMFILASIYGLNPNNRVYSGHGFTHAGITYQILNGKVPPSNPLLAGEALLYPWGYEFIAAVITRIFSITPFYSYAIINIISLGIVMFLIYQISRLLINDRKANILSVIISIFGIIILNPYLRRVLKSFGIYPEWRGVPVFVKFSNINGTPVGLVFYLMFLYSVIKIFVGKKPGFNAALFFLSILGCGFVYAPLLPAVVASTICICLVNIALNRKENPALYLRKSILTMALLITSCLILFPYLFSISSGRAGRIEFFNVKFLFKNAVSYSILSLPILLVISANIRFLKKYLDKRVLINVITVTVATFSCYVFTHMPLRVEYKFLALSMVTLGILGGISLSALQEKCNKSVIFIILLLFMWPTFHNIHMKLKRHERIPITYAEKGKYIYSKNAEENELYEWIRKNTTIDDTFIDSVPFLPVFAQRQLFIARDVYPTAVSKKEKSLKERSLGYGFKIDTVLEVICGCDSDVVKKRNTIVDNIYSLNQNLTSEQIDELSASNNVYVIVRKAMLKGTFNHQGFSEVFRSSKGNFLVYQYAMKTPS